MRLFTKVSVMFWGSVACQRASCVGLLLRWQSLTARQQTPSSPWSLTTLRNVSASPCVKSEAPTTTTTTTTANTKEAETPLKQWDFAIDPFSVVRAHLGCNIAVSSLDPHAFPEADRAFITVHGDDQGVLLDFQVQYDEQNKELSVLAERASSDLSVLLTAPTKSNLYITTKGKGNVHVQNMECADVCKLQTEKGNCVLHSVKGHHIEVLSHGGNVTGMGTIYGNVDIFTSGNGAVDVKKLQGTIMNVSTEHGPLKVKAIYAESTSVTSSTGRVELGHVHGNATVKNISGDVIVDSSNQGYLKVSSKSGDIDIYVGESGSADLHSQEGTVCIRVPSSIRARVELSGASVDISPEVILQSTEHNTTDSQTTVTGHVNSKPQVDQWIKAQADQGPIKLKTQSWFESLKLGS